MEMSSQFQGPALLSFGKQPFVPIESEVGWNPVCLESLEDIKISCRCRERKHDTSTRYPVLYIKVCVWLNYVKFSYAYGYETCLISLCQVVHMAALRKSTKGGKYDRGLPVCIHGEKFMKDSG
jgi:hypothetical protein